MIDSSEIFLESAKSTKVRWEKYRTVYSKSQEKRCIIQLLFMSTDKSTEKEDKSWKLVGIKFIPAIQAFEPIPLPNKDGQTKTRKVVKAVFINPNPRNKNAPLEISIFHQRIKQDGTYEDMVHFPLSQLKAGQEIRMSLDTEQTLALQTILEGLYKYCKENSKEYKWTAPVFALEKVDEIVRVDPNRKVLIQKLIDGNHEKEFWEELEKLNPNGASKLSYARIFTVRSEALKEFKLHMEKCDWNENKWQNFFEKNTWIFGYGLTFKWVKSIGPTLEQVTTGFSIDGSGKRPDGFVQTVAEVATTAFVDIKTPDTSLLNVKEYRPEVYPVGDEVSGGVSQIQVSIEKWLNGARHNIFMKKDNDGYVEKDPIFSYQPKGILVVGALGQFKKEGQYHEARISSFELYRRQLTNPEIITFDELYERAKHIISNVEEASIDPEA